MTSCSSSWTSPLSCVSRSACFRPGVVKSSARRLPTCAEPFPIEADVRHVAPVGAALMIARTALRPDDEQDDDQDREGDQPDQAEKRSQSTRTAQLWAPRPPTATGRPALSATSLSGGGVLASRALVEEVEVENVVVLRAHARLGRKSGTLREPPDKCSARAGRSLAVTNDAESCRRLRLPFRNQSSCSTGTARSALWAAAVPAPCGSRVTSARAWTSP